MAVVDPLKEVTQGSRPSRELWNAAMAELRVLRERVRKLEEQRQRPKVARIARNGAAVIAAFNTSTLVPGSGDVTVYRFNGMNLAAAEVVKAYNLGTGATGTVAANAWLQVKWVEGFWWVDWEQCP